MKYKLKFGIIAIAEYDSSRGAMSAEIDMLSPSASQNRAGTNDGFCISEMLSKFKKEFFIRATVFAGEVFTKTGFISVVEMVPRRVK